MNLARLSSVNRHLAKLLLFTLTFLFINLPHQSAISVDTPIPNDTLVPQSKTAIGGDGKTLTINFMGDVHNERPVDLESLKNLTTFLSNADLNIVNLETAITSYSKKEIKKYNFKTSPIFLDYLSSIGVNLVNIANNHSYDYGLPGFLDTLKALDKKGISYVGGGLNLKSASDGLVIEVKGLKLGFLGLAKVNGGPNSIATDSKPGVLNGYDLKSSVSAIKKLKAKSDILIILTHWGEENTFCPRPSEINSAKLWFDSGADIIVGGHSHTIQPVVLKNNKLVAYSLGNFIFYSSDVKNRETGILSITISSDKKIEYTFKPFLINQKTKVPTPQKDLSTPSSTKHILESSC